MKGAREVEISVSKAWVFYILGVVVILHNSKLAAGNSQHAGRKLADDTSGFISIDCGLPENTSYQEKTSGINYISDATFVDTGLSRSISPEIKDTKKRYVWHLRSFPEGIRNCYTINNITGGNKYLIRAVFLYGNYDGEDKLPEFDLHLGANLWDTVKFTGASVSVLKELIHVPSLNYIQVCLVNKNLGTPFISTIELRQLQSTTYNTTSGSLALRWRYDVGNTVTNQFYRYGYDIYDRIWSPYKNDNVDKWTELSTNLTIDTESYTDGFQPPAIVMSTAATPKDDSAPMEFSWNPDDDESGYYLYMHFAEFIKLEANQSRSFNITFNGEPWFGPFVPRYLNAQIVFTKSALTGGKYAFSIFKTESSTLPPIINAIELYSVKYLLQSETHQDDVDVITKIKSMYEIKRNWQGDPCAPRAYFWEGLNCSYDYSNPPRITSLNLSSSGLTGAISVDISNLVMLEILDLSNNSLNGSVPYSLSQLPHLKVLNLERNQLTGSVPLELIVRSNDGSLSLSVGENPDLCGAGSCKTKNNVVVPIVASVAGLLILSLMFAGVLWWRRRSQKQNATADTKSTIRNMSLDPIQRQFTYFELQSITNNFSRILGKGGFGTVYHGYIDDTQVAVKIMSASSAHGYQQFQSEVKLLMSRVHHRNLTTLFGYCHEGTNVGLIYEFMAQGDLEAHLSDDKKANILTWECRLQIAIDAAQGLEYLHHGSKPPIFHRDVKCTNILLSENFQSKLADFGMSKIYPPDAGSHVSTVVVGTQGYVDPEYYLSNRLTEKSDVYSFGVVLLRIITGRPVMERSREMTQTHISRWVSSMLANGDIRNIVDSRMSENLDINSVWKAVEIAMSCVSPTSVRRPNMSRVVGELKECLATEMAPIEMVNMDLTTEVLYPSAR